LIKQGKSYKQIGEKLWLSPTTIRSLRKVLDNRPEEGYQSYRFRKNQKIREIKEKEIKKYHPESSPFFDWIKRYSG